MWDERYSKPGYAFGKEPNDFLVEVSAKIPKGKLLMLGEGEGRNAVYLASKGYSVTAVDRSRIGLDKVKKLAFDKGIEIRTIHADLENFDFAIEEWSGIISIFCHLPEELRKNVHQKAIKALKPGGVFILEAYTPKQLQFNTGGPKTVEMMMDSKIISQDLEGMHIKINREKDRLIKEGIYHDGMSAVVQVFAIKKQ